METIVNRIVSPDTGAPDHRRRMLIRATSVAGGAALVAAASPFLASLAPSARAEERMTLRHKNTSKWAKQALKQGRDNPETREAIVEQLKRHEALTRKIRGENSNDEDDEVSDLTDSDDGDDVEPDQQVDDRHRSAAVLRRQGGRHLVQENGAAAFLNQARGFAHQILAGRLFRIRDNPDPLDFFSQFFQAEPKTPDCPPDPAGVRASPPSTAKASP